MDGTLRITFQIESVSGNSIETSSMISSLSVSPRLKSDYLTAGIDEHGSLILFDNHSIIANYSGNAYEKGIFCEKDEDIYVAYRKGEKRD